MLYNVYKFIVDCIQPLRKGLLIGGCGEVGRRWGLETTRRDFKEMYQATYVYRKSNYPGEQLWTVGFYDPEGKWYPESDHDNPDDAAERVHYLNGGEAK